MMLVRFWLATSGLASLAMVCLTACAMNAPTSPSAEHDPRLADAVLEAQAQGASEAQLSLLEDAAAVGEVSVEAAKQAMHATVECMQGRGFDAWYVEDVMPSGLVRPTLTFGTAGGGEAAYAECETLESYWIDYLYQTQPSSVALRDSYLLRQLPIVVECLEREGVTVPPDESSQETFRKALDVSRSTANGVDCLAEAEISSF